MRPPFPRPLLALAALVVSALATPGVAEDAEPPGDEPGRVYVISSFELEYLDPHPDHPPLSAVLPLTVELGRIASGYVAPGRGEPARVTIGKPLDSPQPFHASALAELNRKLLRAFHRVGLLGVYVLPNPADIDAQSGADLRPPDRTALRVRIATGRVEQLRTVGRGPRVSGDFRINNKVHRRIRHLSPLQPKGVGDEGATDLLRMDALEDYLFQLNRHPGRYVEAALSAVPEGDGVALDYLVSESKAWFVYGLVTDTGTSETNPWQQRYGYVNRQLTNRDDILSIEYGNTGFNNVHSVRISYEAPWFDRRRASWARRKASDPTWLDREDVPWPGTNSLRWRLGFAWNRFEADHVSLTDEFVGEEFDGDAFLEWNFFQHRALFIDFVGGFQLRNLSVLNRSFQTGDPTDGELFFLPTFGFDLQRINEYSATYGTLRYQVSATGDAARDFGRAQTDSFFQVAYWDAGVSHYLEPLLFPRAWRNPQTKRTSTLAHELALSTRGQYGFNYRLIPQVSMVLGGFYTVRGYPQGEAVGDTVYLGTAEYRFHIPKALPIRNRPLNLPLIGDFRLTPQQVYGRADWDLILRVFIDGGQSVRNKPDRGAENHHQTLVGAGVGGELRIRDNIRARVDWARALTTTYRDDVAGNKLVSTPKGNDEIYFLFSILY